MTMPRIVLGLAMAGLAIACTPQQQAPDKAKAMDAAQTAPAAYRGVAIATQVCAQCHDVGSGTKPSLAIAAPAFAEVANRPQTTVDSLRDWMNSAKHPSMPHYMFNKDEGGDLAAYIRSLRTPN